MKIETEILPGRIIGPELEMPLAPRVGDLITVWEETEDGMDTVFYRVQDVWWKSQGEENNEWRVSLELSDEGFTSMTLRMKRFIDNENDPA